MPGLRGYVCPPGTPTAGTQNPVEWCVGRMEQGRFVGCPHPCVSAPLLAKMYDVERRNHHKGAYISASMLTGGGCARQTWYERHHDFYEHPVRRLYAFRGTIIHALIEDAPAFLADAGWLQEIRMTVALEYPDLPAARFDADGRFVGLDHDRPLVITLGGTCDAYNPPLRKLADFKSMGDEKAERYAMRGMVEEKHEAQLNIYRWLIANTRITPELCARLRAVGYDPGDEEFLPCPDDLSIQGISMMSLVLSGSAQEMKVKRVLPNGQMITEQRLAIVEPVKAWPLAETEAFVRPRALKWYRHLVLGEIPDVVPRSEQWLCRNCPFNGKPCQPEQERQRLARESADWLELID